MIGVTRTRRAARWFALAALAAAAACTSDDGAGPATSTTAVPSTVDGGGRVEDFTTSGVERDGWYWLETEDATATWTLTDLPPDPGTLTLDLQVVVPVEQVTDEWTGSVVVRYRAGDTDGFAAQDTAAGHLVTLPALPVPDRTDVAVLDGSVVVDASSLPAEPSGLVVELGPPPGGTIVVVPGSVRLGPPLDDLSGSKGERPPPKDTSIVRLEGEFTTNGDEIAGWWWLRDERLRHYAHWVFAEVPTLDQGVTVLLHVLATDGPDGGPGVDARFYLTYGFTDADGDPVEDDGKEGKLVGGPGPAVRQRTLLLTVPNVSSPDDPNGYTAQDSLEIPASDVPDGAVGIWFDASRLDPVSKRRSTDEHVAFNRASLGILVELPDDPAEGQETDDGTADDGTSDDGTSDDGTSDDGTSDDGTSDDGTSDDGTSDDGGIDVEADENVLDDPDGLADADDRSGADGVGDLPPGTYEGTLDGEDDDWFAFRLEATQIVDVTFASHGGLVADVELYTPYEELRDPGQSGANQAFSFAATRDEGGRWYLHVTRIRGSGAYTFTLTIRDPDDALRGVDAGDSAATALVVDALGDLPGEVVRNDGGDHYSFTLAAGSSLTVTVLSMSETSTFLVEAEASDDSAYVSDVAEAGQPVAVVVPVGTSERTIDVAVTRNTGPGGEYRMRLAPSGLGQCPVAPVTAGRFVSGGASRSVIAGPTPVWKWLGVVPEDSRMESSTWSFTALPNDGSVRVLFDFPVDRPAVDQPVWPPVAASAYVTYGVTTPDGAVGTIATKFVTLRVESRGTSVTGFAAVGELAIPRARLAGAQDAWWVRVALFDPAAAQPVFAPAGLGTAADSVRLCAATGVTALDGFDDVSSPDPVTVRYDGPQRTLWVEEETGSMFVNPGSDLDGDGLHQGFEDQAIALANPVVELYGTELWLHWRSEHPTVQFVQATLWPSAAAPRYVVLGFLTTWALDPGGGVYGTPAVFEAHRGDSERVWQAWRILDDRHARLEWVATSAHKSYTNHSGVWHAQDRVCNVAYIAAVTPSDLDGHWGYTQLQCSATEFDPDGRLVVQAAGNKHAVYPTAETCEASVIAVADTDPLLPLFRDLCGWSGGPDVDPFDLWWNEDDFDGEPGYVGDGRWRFPAYNVGDAGHPLIDDLDEPETWQGLTDAQVVALTGVFPDEAVWAGFEGGSGFCGGLDAGQPIAVSGASASSLLLGDYTAPGGDCSASLGSKFRGWPQDFVDAMSSRYRVTLRTGSVPGAGTDQSVLVELHDPSGGLLANRLYDGELEAGDTDIVYLQPTRSSSGGDVGTVVIRRGGLDDEVGPSWYLGSVTVEDMATGWTRTYPVEQFVLHGEGLTLL